MDPNYLEYRDLNDSCHRVQQMPRSEAAEEIAFADELAKDKITDERIELYKQDLIDEMRSEHCATTPRLY